MSKFAAPTARLTGEALRAGYDARPVLDGVDLAVAEGKLTVLLGPNGCGKSTLLKTLARTLTPDGGRVCLDGQDIHRRRSRDVARCLGILPQGPDAPEGLTVRQLVAMGRFPTRGYGARTPRATPARCARRWPTPASRTSPSAASTPSPAASVSAAGSPWCWPRRRT